MSELSTEAQLISAALALVGDADLTASEASLARRFPRATNARLVARLRGAIRSGEDPLGDAFTTIRPPDIRRARGATYTPAPLVADMLAWADATIEPRRIVDPGSGSGRFLIAAGYVFPHANLVGIDVDPVAALMLRANLTATGFARRARIIVGDYCKTPMQPTDGATLFIGNPPYVRHHDIAPAAKDWYAISALNYGISASKLAGLHLYFFIRTLQLAKAGDVGCFLTAAEWLDVNYGATLRKLLAGPLGGSALTLIDPKALPFADAITTSAITGFKVHGRPDGLSVRRVASLRDLAQQRASVNIPWPKLETAPRWSIVIKPGAAVPSGHIELGELCRVHRGQVTGANNVWIAGSHSAVIPPRFLVPTITKARELIQAGAAIESSSALRRVIDLPVDLDQLPPHERRAINCFLQWAKSNGADQTYTARHRRAWWSVGLKAPAPILCTYMARRPPAFVRNLCEVRHINIAHGLYPREELSSHVLDALASWLGRKVEEAQGRTYAGGLTKFEPKEVERLAIPRPQILVDGSFL